MSSVTRQRLRQAGRDGSLQAMAEQFSRLGAKSGTRQWDSTLTRRDRRAIQRSLAKGLANTPVREALAAPAEPIPQELQDKLMNRGIELARRSAIR